VRVTGFEVATPLGTVKEGVLSARVTPEATIVHETLFEVEVLKALLPVYCAASAYVPGGSACAVYVATPPLSTAEPIATPLLRKETVPEGVPEAEVTVAVRVTDWPVGLGFGDISSTVVVSGREAAVTVTATPAEAEALKVGLPANWPVKLWEPTASEAACMVAMPETIVAVPSGVLPSRKVTVPVEVPEAAATVAVRVTGWPTTIWLAETWSSVVVWMSAGAVTTSVTTAEVDALKPVAPVYWAVRLCMPAAREDSWTVTTPEVFTVPLPRDVPPSRKVTIPVALPEDAVTVAVRVTDWFVTAGLGDATSAVVVVAAAGALTTSATIDDVEALSVVFPA
jgi:hypothetical protein